jgi:cellulose synthase operon protein YhjQ
MPLICFASPKGGVGKTTLAANVAGGLARGGARVIAIDLDPQNALRLHFGVCLNDPLSFTRVLPQRPDWRAHLRRTGAGVGLLAHGPISMDEANALGAAIATAPELLIGPLGEIAAQRDAWIVVDTMPGPSPQLSALLPLADLLVTVLLGDAASVSLIASVESGAAFGPRQSPEHVAFVLNQFDPRTRLGPAISQAAVAHLGHRLLGTVRRDEWAGESAAAQKLIADYAPSARSAHDIALITRAVAMRLARGEARSERRPQLAGADA